MARALAVAVTTVKVKGLPALVPLGVVTTTLPEAVPAGTVKVMVVAFTTVKPVMATPLSVREVAPTRFVPVMVTSAPTGPEFGLRPVMAGGAGAQVALKVKAPAVTGPVTSW